MPTSITYALTCNDEFHDKTILWAAKIPWNINFIIDICTAIENKFSSELHWQLVEYIVCISEVGWLLRCNNSYTVVACFPTPLYMGNIPFYLFSSSTWTIHENFISSSHSNNIWLIKWKWNLLYKIPTTAIITVATAWQWLCGQTMSNLQWRLVRRNQVATVCKVANLITTIDTYNSRWLQQVSHITSQHQTSKKYLSPLSFNWPSFLQLFQFGLGPQKRILG